MKIVHITTVHNAFDNRIFVKECTSIAEMETSVVLIAPHNRDEKIQNVQIRALSEPKGRFARMVLTTVEAYKKALEEDADIYHFHDPELIPSALLLKIRKKKVVYDVHEDYFSALKQKKYLPKPFRSLIANLFAVFETTSTKFFPKVLAEKYYKKRFPDGIEILNYPKRELLQLPRNNCQTSSLKLIYTGNITRDRGAIEHAMIVNYMADVQVYLVGYCSEELAYHLFFIVGENRNRLHIDGINRFVTFEEIVSYYAMGNWTVGLALFPYSTHYLNKELTKFFEYMSVGIPIICSDFPVWKKLIEETGTGICVDVKNESEIKFAIEYLNNNRDVARKMGSNGRLSIEKQYNWENEAEKLYNLYLKLDKENT